MYTGGVNYRCYDARLLVLLDSVFADKGIKLASTL